MKTLTISYLNHYICFASTAVVGDFSVPDGLIEENDNDLDNCFRQLLGGKDVWVWNRHGTRYLYHYLKEHFQMVRAAGGVVEAPDGERLLIFREGRWDLPKGMVERNESLPGAALREVEEETGVADGVIDNLIIKTYHIYDKYGGWHLKQTSWYMIHATEKHQPSPQHEEGITEAVWVPKALFLTRLEKSYASLRLVCDRLVKGVH